MVGRLIRERRLAKGWSQEDLADAFGTTQRQITRWEGYTTQMPRALLRDRLGTLLGIAPAQWHLAAAEAAPARQSAGPVAVLVELLPHLSIFAELDPPDQNSLLRRFALRVVVAGRDAAVEWRPGIAEIMA